MKQFDTITVGDAFIDAFMSVKNSSEFCQYDKASEKLVLHAGAKILVDECDFMLGGNACNVAVGLSRLGFATALVAELGDDEFAQKIQKGLQKEGVSLELAKITTGAPSTFSVGLTIEGERTLFVRHVQREHKLSLDGVSTNWVYLTSMGKEWRGLYDNVLSFVKQSGAKLAFNPGSQQMHDGVDSFKDIVAAADILFVNRDEAEELLYGKIRSSEEKESAESLLFRLQRMGPPMVVLTDGEKGSFVLDRDNTIYSEGIVHVANPVGKTGVGDAYASGFLGALLSGKDIQSCLQWGTHEAAAVLEHVGAQTNLLTKEQLEERIKEQKVTVVEETERMPITGN